jgi:hypothetical protein
MVMIDKEIHAQFTSQEKALTWVYKMGLELSVDDPEEPKVVVAKTLPDATVVDPAIRLVRRILRADRKWPGKDYKMGTDIDQALASMSERELRDCLGNLVNLLHTEDIPACFAHLRHWNLEETLGEEAENATEDIRTDGGSCPAGTRATASYRRHP